MAIRSETKEKIILLLASGVVLGLSRSPRNYFKVLKGAAKEWKEINRNKLVRIVREFYNDRLIDYKEDKDGSVKIILTKEGQKKALKFKLDEMEIKNRQNGTGNGESLFLTSRKDSKKPEKR